MIVSSSGPVVGVDLGKTKCRVSVTDDAGTLSAIGEGLPGLGAPDAVAQCVDRIVALLAKITRDVSVGRLAIGAAGALSAPDAAADLARAAATQLNAATAVTSDIVTAHIGAFAGGAGVCLIAGTGAVALAVASDGRAAVRDGRGLLVGDYGSGAWLGREALRAAEVAHAGVAPATKLTERIIDPSLHLAHAMKSPDAASLLAAHAPMVIACAQGGDAVCAEIVERAVRHLVATASAAAADVGVHDVAVLGGLMNNSWFSQRVSSHFASVGLKSRKPAGDAIFGAQLVAWHTNLPLERSVHRAEP